MSVAGTGELVRLAFTDRPRYGDPHPEGIAVGHIDLTGDATGGVVGATFLSDGGFLFRLELMAATSGVNTTSVMDAITSHEWATARSGLGALAFDLNWNLENHQSAFAGFTQFAPTEVDRQMIRRFPIGRTVDVSLQTVIQMNAINTNLLVYDFDIVCTYWRKEALSRPGFLASFWESPLVPPVP